MENLRWAVYGVAAAILLGLGVALGWAIWGRETAEPGGPAPEARQPDGSLVVERQPTETPGTAPHKLPEGGREERRVSVTVTPSPPRTLWGVPKEAACGDVTVDLSLVRFEDGSARVVASSPDGRVTGGLDVPIAGALGAEPKRLWSAGVSYSGDRAYGVFVHRDIWRLRLGVEVNAVDDYGTEARALVGWTW